MIRSSVLHLLRKSHFNIPSSSSIRSFSIVPRTIISKSNRNFINIKSVSNVRVHRRFSTEVETKEFRAETKQLLDIVTHSIYTDKEVFLRELISNASDSLEKFRYKQVVGEIKTAGDEPLEINIITDNKAKTLTICDNGIGMSKDDLVNNLGRLIVSHIENDFHYSCV